MCHCHAVPAAFWAKPLLRENQWSVTTTSIQCIESVRLCPAPHLHSQAILIGAKDNSTCSSCRRHEKISSLRLQRVPSEKKKYCCVFSLSSPGFASGHRTQPVKVPMDQLACNAARRLPEVKQVQLDSSRWPGCHSFGILSAEFYCFYLEMMWKITDGSPAKAVAVIRSKDIKSYVLFFTLTKLECFLLCNGDIILYRWTRKGVHKGKALVRKQRWSWV